MIKYAICIKLWFQSRLTFRIANCYQWSWPVATVHWNNLRQHLSKLRKLNQRLKSFSNTILWYLLSLKNFLHTFLLEIDFNKTNVSNKIVRNNNNNTNIPLILWFHLFKIVVAADSLKNSADEFTQLHLIWCSDQNVSQMFQMSQKHRGLTISFHSIKLKLFKI